LSKRVRAGLGAGLPAQEAEETAGADSVHACLADDSPFSSSAFP